LERYIDFCNRDAGDSIILAIDSDDYCPVEVGRQFAARVKSMGSPKPVSVWLFNREYESIFLPSIARIAGMYPDFKWSGTTVAQHPETIRDVKGTISKMMSADRAYKPTRDQARFTEAIDLGATRAASRSFRHFETSLLWLVAQRPLSGVVHPG
jgi:isopentenyldiphosphate isomerase